MVERNFLRGLIMQLNQGKTYEYMKRHFFPKLRNAGYIKVFYEAQPILAIVFAIARGFGFDNLMESQIVQGFGGPSETTEVIFQFVNSLSVIVIIVLK